jgi:hypothetical protein
MVPRFSDGANLNSNKQIIFIRKLIAEEVPKQKQVMTIPIIVE